MKKFFSIIIILALVVVQPPGVVANNIVSIVVNVVVKNDTYKNINLTAATEANRNVIAIMSYDDQYNEFDQVIATTTNFQTANNVKQVKNPEVAETQFFVCSGRKAIKQKSPLKLTAPGASFDIKKPIFIASNNKMAAINLSTDVNSDWPNYFGEFTSFVATSVPVAINNFPNNTKRVFTGNYNLTVNTLI